MAEYRNVQRSKRLIRTAFANLIKEKKDISKITVKEIVEKAHISKSTFYCHYQDIYAVGEEFDQEIVHLIEVAFNENITSEHTDFIRFIEALIKSFDENKEIYSMLLCADVSGSYIDKLKTICVERLNKDMRLEAISDDDTTRLTEITIITNGIVYTIVDYLKGKIKATLPELIDKINRIVIKLSKKA